MELKTLKMKQFILGIVLLMPFYCAQADHLKPENQAEQARTTERAGPSQAILNSSYESPGEMAPIIHPNSKPEVSKSTPSRKGYSPSSNRQEMLEHKWSSRKEFRRSLRQARRAEPSKTQRPQGDFGYYALIIGLVVALIGVLLYFIMPPLGWIVIVAGGIGFLVGLIMVLIDIL